MKKLILSFIVLFAFAFTVDVSGQIYSKQIAFGAKSIDSVTGTAAGATIGTKYYYFNTLGTVAGGLATATVPITQYEILGVSAYYNAATKTADLLDSVHSEIEISYDNTNWTKVTCAGATTQATATMTRNGLPKPLGVVVAYGADAGSTYLLGGDMITTKAAAGGGLWYFNGLIAPYVRVKTMSYDDATGAAYPIIWVHLKKL